MQCNCEKESIKSILYGSGMKRLITTALQLCIGTTLLAQGWVADEASKDNSGGVFSGIMGLFLLIGAIWFFGYIMDKIS